MTTPPLAQFPGQPAQAARDVNTASLCRIGQETVQDIVLRTMEIFQLLRNMRVSSSLQRHPSTGEDFTPMILILPVFSLSCQMESPIILTLIRTGWGNCRSTCGCSLFFSESSVLSMTNAMKIVLVWTPSLLRWDYAFSITFQSSFYETDLLFTSFIILSHLVLNMKLILTWIFSIVKIEILKKQ